MISVRSTVRSIVFDTKKLEQDLRKVLRYLRYEDFDISVWLTTDATMAQYNQEFRNKKGPTNVLSFPFYPSLQPGQRIKPASEEEKNIGDILIAVPYVERESRELNVSLEYRVRQLVIHGLCHMLGYDHKKDDEYHEMQDLEDTLLDVMLNAD